MAAGQAMLWFGGGALFVGLAVALAATGAVVRDRRRVARSLAIVRAIRAGDPVSDERPFAERVVDPATAALARLGRRLTRDGRAERYRGRLELAGGPAGWDTERVLATKVLGTLLAVPAGLAGTAFAGPAGGVALGLAGGLAGSVAVDGWLWRLGRRRRDRLIRDLPDALDLLTISVEAGLTFDAAMAQVARRTDGPLAGEFFRVLQEMAIGVGRSDAMRALADRTGLSELRGFVTAMVQADTFGVPVAGVLRVQSAELRVRRRQRAEEAAQKVPVKIVFPLIFCIMPALFIVIIGPAAISILRTFAGR